MFAELRAKEILHDVYWRPDGSYISNGDLLRGPHDLLRRVDDKLLVANGTALTYRRVEDNWGDEVHETRRIIYAPEDGQPVTPGMGITVSTRLTDWPPRRIAVEFPALDALRTPDTGSSPSPVSMYFELSAQRGGQEVWLEYDATIGQLQQALIEVGPSDHLSAAPVATEGDRLRELAGRIETLIEEDKNWPAELNQGLAHLQDALPLGISLESPSVKVLVQSVVPELVFRYLSTHIGWDGYNDIDAALSKAEFEFFVGAKVLEAAFSKSEKVGQLMDKLANAGLSSRLTSDRLLDSLIGNDELGTAAKLRLELIHELYKPVRCSAVGYDNRVEAQSALVEYFMPTVQYALADLIKSMPSISPSLFLKLITQGEDCSYSFIESQDKCIESMDVLLSAEGHLSHGPIQFSYADKSYVISLQADMYKIAINQRTGAESGDQPILQLFLPQKHTDSTDKPAPLYEALDVAANLNADPQDIAAKLGTLSIRYLKF